MKNIEKLSMIKKNFVGFRKKLLFSALALKNKLDSMVN